MKINPDGTLTQKAEVPVEAAKNKVINQIIFMYLILNLTKEKRDSNNSVTVLLPTEKRNI